MRAYWGLLPHMRHKFNLLVSVSDNLARSEKLGQALNSAVPAVEDVIGLLLREKGGPAADSRQALHFLVLAVFPGAEWHEPGCSEALDRVLSSITTTDWLCSAHPALDDTGLKPDHCDRRDGP